MNFIKNIIRTQLFRISSLNLLSILVRVAGGLLSSKMIALFIGPAGMTLTGNLRDFLSSVDIFSTLGLQNGIIKYTAENENDVNKLRRIMATVSLSIIAGIIICSLVLLLPAQYWSTRVFDGAVNYAWVFRALAIALPLYTGNLVFVALLNGLGNYKEVIYLNIWGNVLGVLLSAIIIWQLGINGALIGLVIYPAILFFFSLYYVQRRFTSFDFLKFSNFDSSLLRGLFSYSVMSIITATLAPFISISIRSMIIESSNINEAGYYTAINRIASFYLMFASTLLTLYFLPKLSVAKTNKETQNVFLSYYKSIVPLYAVSLVSIYVLRLVIIKLLFSTQFLPMSHLFAWQLTGDFFKICSLILGYEFFAKKLTKAFIITEIFSFCVLYVSSSVLINKYGSEGAVMAHALTYFAYLVVLVTYFRKKITGHAV